MATLRALGYGFLILCSASLSCANISEIAAPKEAIFNILDFGAKAGGKGDISKALGKAWQAACQYKGGNRRLVIPQGEFSLSDMTFHGPCYGKSPIVVQIIGTLKACEKSDMGPEDLNYWIGFEHLDGLVVTGGGTFNARGDVNSPQISTTCRDDPSCSRKFSAIEFLNVTNARIEDFTSVNSTNFHYVLYKCNNFTAKRLRIVGPRNTPDTDGIYISDSTNVKIHRSHINTGDNCVSVGPASTNILVKRISCVSRNGIRIGGLPYYYIEKQDVKGISVKNSTFSNTENGMAIWTSPHMAPCSFSDIIFQDIVMNSVKTPILIDIANCTETKCPGKTSQVKISNVHFQNIKGTSASKNAIKIKCSSQYPCHNLQLSDIDLNYFNASTKSKSVPTFSTCVNADPGYTGVQNPPPCRI